MDLATWAEEYGEGAVSELHYRARVSRNTVKRALRGDPVRREIAIRLSEATDGKVSAAAILLGTKAA